MKLNNTILIIALFASSLSVNARNYYVDSSAGNDGNNGVTPQTAWKSLARASQTNLQPGDSLLLARGAWWEDRLDISASGRSGQPITITAYGQGEKPRIGAPDSSMWAVRILNSDYLTLSSLDITNHGSSRLAGRTGAKVENSGHGTSRSITLCDLDIHDVNGSLIKNEGGGSGILIECTSGPDRVPSNFDGLTISDCTVRRCERNAMIWSAPWSRKDWFPSRNVLVTRNLIEEVPGDGIVPIGCDGAVIEYNVMRRCSSRMPVAEAAAGIWPWSCDNTVIRFNEVSDHHAMWDGQGFDSDYNCRNTHIEYNYSHDNIGGFLLVCNAGPGEFDQSLSAGNDSSVIRYNLSVADGDRTGLNRIGQYFSPSIHMSGPVTNTLIERNIILAPAKSDPNVMRRILVSDSWGGYAHLTLFRNNIFHAAEPSGFDLGKSTANSFEKNQFSGSFSPMPSDSRPDISPADDIDCSKILTSQAIASGKARVNYPSPEAIRRIFDY